MENNGWKMMWKTVFSIVWEAKEKREDGKPGRKFSSEPTNFFPPKSGGKLWRENSLTVELHKCPLPPTLLTNTTIVLESSKKKKKTQRSRAGEKKERKHFLSEGEKERKEGGDK